MNKSDEMLQAIEKYGMMAKGKAEMIRHLYGEKLSYRQAVIAKCYDCTGWAADGKEDCCMPECALYPFMPYGKKPEKKKMSEENRKRLVEQLRRGSSVKESAGMATD
jgi:hypothetical protein